MNPFLEEVKGRNEIAGYWCDNYSLKHYLNSCQAKIQSTGRGMRPLGFVSKAFCYSSRY